MWKLIASPIKEKVHSNDILEELENMIKCAKADVCDEYDKKKLLQEKLKRSRNELKRVEQWIMSSKIVTSSHELQSRVRQGLSSLDS
ncbi:hypothetical protein HAX54_025251 [Datura stramonium]|uniref:Uncharacterized protein n=1 Tax=Datura stramonium TaxID=4076 RepID=A0ABS8V216_DATST|nr:hypothetical protein [Datura stramonium]